MTAKGAKTRGLAGEIGAGILSLGRDALRYLLVFAVAIGGSRALLWAWRRSGFGLSDIVEGPDSFGTRLVYHGILATSVACVIYALVQRLPRWPGALWAGLPAVLLMPITAPLATCLWDLDESVNVELADALSAIVIFGGACWAILILNAALPRWSGLCLGGLLYLAVAVAKAGYVAHRMAQMGWPRDVQREILVLHTLDEFWPVWVSLALLKLTAGRERPTRTSPDATTHPPTISAG